MAKITLAAARVNSELTQNEVANAMGVSKSTIIGWEKYRAEPSISQAFKLAELYHCHIDDIIFFRA